MDHSNPNPPLAKTIPHTFEHLGHKFTDPYAWLQDKEDPEVIQYLQSENQYTKTVLAHTQTLQETLFQEMKGRIKEADTAVPAIYGDYYYYHRTLEGQQYRLFCRKKDHPEASEEIILDENELAQGLEYCRVFYTQPSPNNRFLAYAVDVTGSREFDLYVKDLSTGQSILGPIQKTAWDVAWASDNRTIFYITFNESHRPYRLIRRTIDSAPPDDHVIYQESDDSYNLNIKRSRSGGYIFMTAASSTTTEVHFLPADTPFAGFTLIHPRQHRLEYYLEHQGSRFLIHCNENAENFKLLAAPINAPAKENWRELIPHRSDTLIDDVLPFQDHLVLFERKDGLQQIRISSPDAVSNVHQVAFPDPTYALSPGENRQYNLHSLRFTYSSLVTPESTIDYNLTAYTWEVKKQQEIPSGYDRSQYTSQRLHALAPDGVLVPISLVYRKDFKQDASHPLLLYGYGSYGSSTDPNFNPQRFSLIDRGFVFAIAHIRGGSELGRSWYENGRLMHKKNTFTDFIACAEHLIAQKFTSPDRLAIQGGSAGGLLVSAVANMRPDLFKTVIAMVPFTNVIVAMLDRNLPLTVIEYEQWGNPDNPTEFEYMLSYSPYENVKPVKYPNIYVKTGLNDLQVPYWDPAKWVARLRALKRDQNRLVLVTNMGAGHSGASGRFDYLREVAQYMAFLIDTLG